MKCFCTSISEQFKPLVSFSSFQNRKAYKCLDCGSILISPNPKDISYDKSDYMGFIDWKEYLGYFLAINSILEFPKVCSLTRANSSLLDYGCGNSRYPEYFRLTGLTSYGYDINSKLIAHLNSNAPTNNTIYFSSLDQVANVGPFDCILLNHVLEHLIDPHDFFKDVSSLLSSHGCIVVVGPNVNSANRKLLGEKWIGYSPDEHIWLPSLVGIEKLCAQYGLSVTNVFYNSCCGKNYDFFMPRSGLLPRIYYKLVMPIFEMLRLGDQSIFIIKRGH
jgi:2-polyprenyl-3-methyl-5-hydroxy-6-metoxy-1,4-benzoquinol methylase